MSTVRLLTLMLNLSLLGGVGLLALDALREAQPARAAPPAASRDIAEIRARQTPLLSEALDAQGLRIGAPVHLRIYKEESRLELWVRDGPAYRLFRHYPVCAWSGRLGPKLREGDRQAPEGFYTVGRNALNPRSSYHLSFDLGFPNAHDRARGWTGSYLMVHGDCVSIGCYAMTDAGIEEIYVLVEAALAAGQAEVPVHVFPFRMTEARLDAARTDPWHGFWTELKPGWDAFEATHVPPVVRLEGDRYRIGG
jgi:murein L,D-transpeptidase YafK